MKKANLLLILFLSVFSIKAVAQEVLNVGDYYNSNSMFEGSIHAKVPLNFVYKYSCSQQIYMAEYMEDAKDKLLTGVTFRCKPDEYSMFEFTNNVKIYLTETTQSEYVKNAAEMFEWIAIAENELVCSTSLDIDFATPTYIDEEIEIEFIFNTPYYYRGNNLVMTVAQENDEPIEGMFTDFYCFPANVLDKPYRTLCVADDSKSFSDPHPTTSTFALKQTAVALFTYEESTTPPPPVYYSVSLTATEGGTANGAGQFEENSEVTVIAIANENYHFENWTEGKDIVSTDSEYTFTITSDRYLKANFKSIVVSYSVALSASEGGRVEGAGNYEEGALVTVKAIAEENYKFTNWTENGEPISEQEEYSFTIGSNRSLTANFERVTSASSIKGDEFKLFQRNGVLIVDTDLGEYKIIIWNSFGNKIYENKYDGPIELEIIHWNKGIYLLELHSKLGKIVKKLIL